MKWNFRSFALGLLLLHLSLPLYAEGSRKPRTKFALCSTKLRDAIGNSRLTVHERQQALKWYVKVQNRISAQLQIAWSRISTSGLKEGEYYFWWREEGLREINKLAKGIAFTERYLLLKDWHLTQILNEHPEWGTLIHRNFKDRVIVTSLAPDDLQSKLIFELNKRLKPDLIDYSTEAPMHYALLMSGTKLGVSDTFEGAHLKATGLDVATWYTRTKELRASLELQLSKGSKKSIDILSSIYKKKKNNNGYISDTDIAKILTKFSINAKDSDFLIHEIHDYLDLLQGADLLPPPNTLSPKEIAKVEKWLQSGRNITAEIQQLVARRPWTQRHATFFKNAFDAKAKHVMSLDIRGFSEQAFAVRDLWVRGDNPINELRGIYVDSTNYLNAYFDDLIKFIGDTYQVTVVANFRSGDDALFAFGPEISNEKMVTILEGVKKYKKDIYAAVASRQTRQDSLGLLVQAARVGVSEEKDKK